MSFGGTALDLKQAIRLAVENSPHIQAALQAVKNSELEERSARMRFFPVFEVQSQMGLDRFRSTTAGLSYSPPSPWASKLGFSMTESLYDNGINWIQLKIAKKNRELAELRLQKIRDQIVRELAFEYYNFALQSKNLEIQGSQLELIRRQFNNVSHAYQQGVKTGKDYLRLKTQVMRSEIDYDNAKFDLDKSRLEMNRLLERDHSETQSYDFSVNIREQNPWIPRSLPSIENHYETLLSKAEIFLQDLQVQIAERRRGPEIYLTSGASYGSQNFIGTGSSWVDNVNWEYNALLGIRYTFWDFGTRKRNIQVASGVRLITERQLESGLIRTKKDMEKLMLDLQLKTKNLRATENLLKLEKKNYSTIEGEYRVGRVQFLDLINSLRDLSSARLSYITNLLAVKKDLVDYQYHSRGLYDWILAEQ